MLEMTIEYPKGEEPTAEEKAFDSFLLSKLTDKAVTLRSKTVNFTLEEIEELWQEFQSRPKPN